MWRKLIKLKDMARNFKGKWKVVETSFWFDTLMGDLYDLAGLRGFLDLCIPKNASEEDKILEQTWRRNHINETLNQTEANLNFLKDRGQVDKRHIFGDIMEKSLREFSS